MPGTTYKDLGVFDGTPSGAAGLALNNSFVAIADRIGSYIENAADPDANDDDQNTGSNGTAYQNSLWLNTTDKTLWLCIDATATAAVWKHINMVDIVLDTTPQLGGALDVNGQALVSTSNGDVALTPNGTGSVLLSGSVVLGSDGQLFQFGAAQDYSLQWDGDNAVHTISAGTFDFVGGTLRIRGGNDFRMYDSDNINYTEIDNNGVIGRITVSSGDLSIQNTANNNVTFFINAAEGETRELQIWGYRTGDTKRHLAIGVGVDVADTVSFDGLSNYRFDGNVVLPADDQKLYFGAAADYSIEWDGDDAVHTISAGNFTFTGGNFGIGTGVTLQGNVFQVKATTDGDGITIQRGSGDADTFADLKFLLSNDGNAEPETYIRVYRRTGFSDNDMVFHVGGTDVLYLDNNGNVGINEAAPNALLDVNGTTRLGDSDTNYTAVSATGDQTFTGSAGFYPRTLAQDAEPAAGTGATQIDSGEMLIWIDTNDSNKSYLVYNYSGTITTILLT